MEDKDYNIKDYTPQDMIDEVKVIKEEKQVSGKWSNVVRIWTSKVCVGKSEPHFRLQIREGGLLLFELFTLFVHGFEAVEQMEEYIEEFKRISGDDFEIEEKEDHVDNENKQKEHKRHVAKSAVYDTMERPLDFGHICTNGQIAKYPSGLCSMCRPKHWPTHVDLKILTNKELKKWNKLASKIFVSHEELLKRFQDRLTKGDKADV